MTYRDLYKYIKNTNDTDLDSDVTVWVEDQDEYYKIHRIGHATDGVLDDDHPFLIP